MLLVDEQDDYDSPVRSSVSGGETLMPPPTWIPTHSPSKTSSKTELHETKVRQTHPQVMNELWRLTGIKFKLIFLIFFFLFQHLLGIYVNSKCHKLLIFDHSLKKKIGKSITTLRNMVIDIYSI